MSSFIPTEKQHRKGGKSMAEENKEAVAVTTTSIKRTYYSAIGKHMIYICVVAEEIPETFSIEKGTEKEEIEDFFKSIGMCIVTELNTDSPANQETS
jgi:hypothetical protein